VRAPAAGVVRRVVDGTPEVLGESRWLGYSRGNRGAPGEFLFIGHLRLGTVAAGERVVAGQVLGHVGNSGNSSEPHVHLQDTMRPYFGGGDSLLFFELSGRRGRRQSGHAGR